MSDKKKPKVRFNFDVLATDVEEWKVEADLAKQNMSQFARKACERYAAFLKKRRLEKSQQS